MKVKKVNVGLVGLGMVCESHLKAYSAHPDAEVIAVCDLDAARLKEIANKYGIPKTYTSYEQMLQDPEINTVDITTRFCILQWHWRRPWQEKIFSVKSHSV